jgi:hypothetical protein
MLLLALLALVLQPAGAHSSKAGADPSRGGHSTAKGKRTWRARAHTLTAHVVGAPAPVAACMAVGTRSGGVRQRRPTLEHSVLARRWMHAGGRAQQPGGAPYLMAVNFTTPALALAPDVAQAPPGTNTLLTCARQGVHARAGVSAARASMQDSWLAPERTRRLHKVVFACCAAPPSARVLRRALAAPAPVLHAAPTSTTARQGTSWPGAGWLVSSWAACRAPATSARS